MEALQPMARRRDIMHGFPVMKEMSAEDIEAFNDGLSIGDPLNIATLARGWRCCEHQAYEVSVMYDANPRLTWNLFHMREEKFTDDKLMRLLGLEEPYFISMAFLADVVCYRLEGHSQPEWAAAIGHEYLCRGTKKLCRCILRLMAVRRIAGKYWERLWFPMDVCPMMLK